MKFFAFSLTISALFGCQEVDARQYDDRFRLAHPLTDSTFNHWKSSASAVFLKRKTILTPEIPGSTGMIFAKNAFTLHSFSLEVDLSIHNKRKSSLPRGAMHMYLLRDNPMQTARTFADGLEDQFDGVRVTIEEGAEKNQGVGSDRAHKITITARDESYKIVKEDSCVAQFEDMKFIIATRDTAGALIVAMADYSGNSKKETTCGYLELPEDYFSEDHETFIFIAANAGDTYANEHVIHNVRFQDIKHLHDSEEINSPEDDKPFYAKANDMLRKKALADNSAHTIQSYNQQQVKHNELYSTLVSLLISNSERVIQNLESLPHADISKNITDTAEVYNNRFSLLQKQFEGYHKDIKEYKTFVADLIEKRNAVRQVGHDDDAAYVAQDNIITRMDRYLNTLDELRKTIDKQHLQTEIRNYEKNMKQYDEHYVQGDKNMLARLGQQKRHDEHLSDREMETLFSQQIRSMFSKSVRSYEADIRGHVASGNSRGRAGSAFVDMVAGFGVIAVVAFAYFAYKKLQDQKDTLVL